MDRDRLVDELRWLAEGNPRYAGTGEEGRQDPVVAHLMADDFCLATSTIGRSQISSTAYVKGIRRELRRSPNEAPLSGEDDPLPPLPASGIKVYQDLIVARAGRRGEGSVGETGA